MVEFVGVVCYNNIKMAHYGTFMWREEDNNRKC